MRPDEATGVVLSPFDREILDKAGIPPSFAGLTITASFAIPPDTALLVNQEGMRAAVARGENPAPYMVLITNLRFRR